MGFSRIFATLAMMLAVSLLAGGARADEHTIVIHHMELDRVEAKMRVGDAVTFENQSDMAHNLYITYSDGSIDNLDTQFPGMKRVVTLKVAGPATIRCWIHPIIKAEVDILDKADADPR